MHKSRPPVILQGLLLVASRFHHKQTLLIATNSVSLKRTLSGLVIFRLQMIQTNV